MFDGVEKTTSSSKSIQETEIENKLNYLTPPTPTPSQPGMFNVVIIASGYNSSNMTNFQSKAESRKDTLLNTEPFKTYVSKINVNIYSNSEDLGCYTGCDNIDRLMCCNWSSVVSAAAASGYYYDEIIVIHNTSVYAGGGFRESLDAYKLNSYNTYCAVYDGYYSDVMALHEFGHSFGNLCDEYSYGSEGYSYYDCVNCRSTCNDWSDTGGTSCQQGLLRCRKQLFQAGRQHHADFRHRKFQPGEYICSVFTGRVAGKTILFYHIDNYRNCYNRCYILDIHQQCSKRWKYYF